ncbi:MAG: hypothetical protein M3395_03405 [Chloroflexota bacterium]|nr:hypothetical protein [Chloroflexota bacterium]
MRRTVRGLVMGLGLTLLLGAPVAAGTSESRYFERGQHASASKGFCRSAPGSGVTKCREFSIDVFAGRRGGTDPATRFSGYEVRVLTSYETVDHVTGRILRQGFAIGEATNREALRVRFDGLRSASVEGTIRVSETRCDRSGRCEDSRRRVALDLEWAAGTEPASKIFIYYRINDGGCESTYTETRRERSAQAVGDVDGRGMRVHGSLVKTDQHSTQVCQ